MSNQDGTPILERIVFIYKYHRYFYNVVGKVITAEEYEEITGEPYIA